MSLYNLVHGHNPNASKILRALAIDLHQIDRFRDASFGKDGDAHVFHLLCRTGSSNRASSPNAALTAHPLYVRDHDDDHDPTYAHYYFRIPQEVLDQITAQGLTLDDVTDTETLAEKNQAAIDVLESSLQKGEA